MSGSAPSPSECPSPPLEWVSLEGIFIEFYKKKARKRALNHSSRVSALEQRRTKIGVLPLMPLHATCNDKASCDDCLYHTQRYERTKRTRWSLLVDCATYLYTFLICLCVRLSNYRTFQKIPSCDLSCDQVVWPSYRILSPFSIFRTLRLVRLRIVLVLPIPPTVLSLVLAGDLWHLWR